MLFNFQLCPLVEVTPFGKEGDYSLHWFGLTDGWYWMRVGDDELFRFSDDFLAYRAQHGWHDTLPYLDYQVVRLWEDVQYALPKALEPVPPRILERFPTGMDVLAWYHLTQMWLEQTDDDDETVPETFFRANWPGDRELDCSHLSLAPRIFFYSDGDHVTICWDCRGKTDEGISAWQARLGTITMPRSTFINEVCDFDRRLITQMAERIREAQTHWPLPHVKIDLEGLVLEHEVRAHAMRDALARARAHPPTPWDQVEAAMERVLREMGQ